MENSDDPDEKSPDAKKADDHCPNVARCSMFPIFTQELILNIYKRSYCYSNYGRCARLNSMQSGTSPAKTLLPDGSTLDHDV